MMLYMCVVLSYNSFYLFNGFSLQLCSAFSSKKNLTKSRSIYSNKEGEERNFKFLIGMICNWLKRRQERFQKLVRSSRVWESLITRNENEA